MQATDPPQAPRWEANDDAEDDVNSTKYGCHRRIIRRVSEYQGRDAEDHIDDNRRNEDVTGDGTKTMMDGVEEIADGPKKKEDRCVQEHMRPVHEPYHVESVEALE